VKLPKISTVFQDMLKDSCGENDKIFIFSQNCKLAMVSGLNLLLTALQTHVCCVASSLNTYAGIPLVEL
jgi:hypothetical protein